MNQFRQINLDHDYKPFLRMLRKRGMPLIKKEYLPSTGFIIDDLCACFVYLTNSKVCILEHLVAKEGINFDILMGFIDNIIMWCKQQGYEIACAFTSLDIVKEHAKRFGAKSSSDYTFLFTKLN